VLNSRKSAGQRQSHFGLKNPRLGQCLRIHPLMLHGNSWGCLGVLNDRKFARQRQLQADMSCSFGDSHLSACVFVVAKFRLLPELIVQGVVMFVLTSSLLAGERKTFWELLFICGEFTCKRFLRDFHLGHIESTKSICNCVHCLSILIAACLKKKPARMWQHSGSNNCILLSCLSVCVQGFWCFPM